MFWVLRKKDDKTLAMTADKVVAEWMVKHYDEECEVREVKLNGESASSKEALF